ncbi:Fe-S cluster assembly ATPase SufC [Patescibacteria group bacterium]|nr:Fe-S cluster assembly ATPase SufC [Patescibacteria group bacterium]
MLEIKNLSVNRDKKQILKDINLSIKPGEIHVLMGPNGSGKSTLSLALMKNSEIEITKGRILLDSNDTADLQTDEISKNGLFLAFQYPLEIEGVPLISFLKLVYEAHLGEKVKTLDFLRKVNSICDNLKIQRSLLDRYLNVGFSGGEKKKIEILQMALISPKYIILDETDSGLDISALKTVSDSILKIKQETNCGILIITHYLRFLKYLKPDYVHILMRGEIVKSGDYKLAQDLDKKGYEKF